MSLSILLTLLYVTGGAKPFQLEPDEWEEAREEFCSFQYEWGKADWSSYENRFPYDLREAEDDSRTQLYVPFGTWKITNGAVDLEDERFSRYHSKMLVEAACKLFSVSPHGMSSEAIEKMSTFDIILDLNGWDEEKSRWDNCKELSIILMDVVSEFVPTLVNKWLIQNGPPETPEVSSFYEILFKSHLQDLRRSLDVDLDDLNLETKFIK